MWDCIEDRGSKEDRVDQTHGIGDYTLWYGDKSISKDINLVIVEAKRRGSAEKGLAQALGYMGMSLISGLYEKVPIFGPKSLGSAGPSAPIMGWKEKATHMKLLDLEQITRIKS